MKICDSHIHSNNSFDAFDPVDEMCLAAIEKNIHSITFTDHCETWAIDDVYEDFGDFKISIPKSLKEIAECQKKYSDKIKIYKGIELGNPCFDEALSGKAMAFGDYDFVLASVHKSGDMLDYFYADYLNSDIDILLTNYFKEALKTANYYNFDSLAHLTYPLRYIMEIGLEFHIERYFPLIDEIFRILIKNEKALELNTSGLRKKMNTTMPDRGLMQRYKDIGGRLVTIGSDAHHKEDIGANLADAIKILSDCGFKEYVIYERHKPVFIDIC